MPVIFVNEEVKILQQSCGSGVIADGRLSDLIRRVATFGMGLMKLDLRQVCFVKLVAVISIRFIVLKLLVIKQESGRHAETLDAITKYLDMGKYSEWDEGKKLEFLTRELKGKRPLVPPSIEVMVISDALDTENNVFSTLLER